MPSCVLPRAAVGAAAVAETGFNDICSSVFLRILKLLGADCQARHGVDLHSAGSSGGPPSSLGASAVFVDVGSSKMFQKHQAKSSS